jgi:serine/threonine protein kinase
VAPDTFDPLPLATLTGAILDFRKIGMPSERLAPETCLVRDTVTKKEMALTVIKARSRDQVFDFFREIFTQIYCSHSAIVPLIGWNVHIKPKLLLYVGTGNVQMQRLDVTKPYNPTKKKIILYGIGRALAHMHLCGVAHRNLKPGSIVVDTEGRPFVADFGYAKFHVTTGLSRVMESTIYSAPEFYMAHEFELTCDVYSFAMLFHALVSGREWDVVPDSNFPINSILRKKINDGFRPSLERMPAKQAALIDRMWSSNPDERPPMSEVVRVMEQEEDFWSEGPSPWRFDEYRASWTGQTLVMSWCRGLRGRTT